MLLLLTDEKRVCREERRELREARQAGQGHTAGQPPSAFHLPALEAWSLRVLEPQAPCTSHHAPVSPQFLPRMDLPSAAVISSVQSRSRAGKSVLLREHPTRRSGRRRGDPESVPGC